MMKLELTPLQRWFIRLAITHKEEILPLSNNSLDDDIFKEDYGVSKTEVLKELDNLISKLD